MLDLRQFIPEYRKLVRDTLLHFESEQANFRWSCVAFDAAPEHGRLGLNFDSRDTSDAIVRKYEKNGPAWYGADAAGRFNNNCADFSFSRFVDLDLYNAWVVPWESDDRFLCIDVDGQSHEVDQEQEGSEGYNKLVFPLLTRVRDLEIDWVRENARNRDQVSRFGVQMCDSALNDFILL